MNSRKRLPPVIAVLLMFLSLCVFAQGQTQTQVTASNLSPAPYRTGERLTYNISFSNFPTAAHVELFVSQRAVLFGRDAIEVRAHVETTGVVSAALYSINNDYISYIDPTTGLPFRTQQVVYDGARANGVSLDYNQPAGISAIPAKSNAPGAFGTYDFVSALYRLRALPLAQGATYGFSVRHNETQYDATLSVVGRELVKTNVGSSNAIVGQVRVPGNKPADAYRVRIYFSDDERHIPMLITARHPVGEIRAELASAEIIAPQPTNPAGTPQATDSPSPLVAEGNPAQPRPGTAPATVNPGVASAGSPLPSLPFRVGEQLNFNFYLGEVAQPVGTASFQVRARANYFGRDGLLLSSRMQTTGNGQRLFPVNDEMNSYVDAATLLPFRTELRLQEGRRRANWLVTSDQDRGTVIFDDGTRLEIPIGTHDLVSIVYALRSFDLSPPKRTAVSMLINKRTRTLSITALQRAVIDLGGQKIPAVQLSLVTDDPQGDRFNLRLWVSTDSRRLPLRLTATTPLGPIRADLAILPVSTQ